MSSRKQRTPEEIIKALAKLRPRIARAKDHLNALYAEQNALYVEGHSAGTRTSHMARAGGIDYMVGDQAVRDALRRAGVEPKARREVAAPQGAKF
jgi:hypothetical protein